MVMEDDSCLRGLGLESRCHILDGHDIFSHRFVVKNCIVSLKRLKVNEKEAGDGPFKKVEEDLLYQKSFKLNSMLKVDKFSLSNA